jgi:hypothetical protein
LSSLYSVCIGSWMQARSSQSLIIFAVVFVLFLWVEGVRGVLWVVGAVAMDHTGVSRKGTSATAQVWSG